MLDTEAVLKHYGSKTGRFTTKKPHIVSIPRSAGKTTLAQLCKHRALREEIMSIQTLLIKMNVRLTEASMFEHTSQMLHELNALHSKVQQAYEDLKSKFTIQELTDLKEAGFID